MLKYLLPLIFASGTISFANEGIHSIVEFVHLDQQVMYLAGDFVTKVQEELDVQDAARVLDALVFAAEKHKNQKRKNAERAPYVVHPIGVANQILTIAKVRDADILIGALLHDTVEDTDATFEEVRARFGEVVEGYVREVTDDKSLSKAERKRLQIVNAPKKSRGGALIKLSDKVYNCSDLVASPIEGWSHAQVMAYLNQAKEVVDVLPAVSEPLKERFYEIYESLEK